MSRPYPIILFFCLLPALAAAQEWFPVGARWEVNQLIFFPPGNTYFNIRVVGEDTLDARLMRRLEGGCACAPWHDYSHVYEDNDRVYAYDPIGDSYKLLYDFTLEPGDTLTYALPDDGPTYFRLDSVTLADFNGTTIRVQHLSWLEGWFFIGSEIYEFIGGTSCLFPQVQYCDPGSGAVICYEDPSHGIFNVSGPCLSALTPTGSATHTFRIYPNPATSWVNIESDAQIHAVRLAESTSGRNTAFPLSGAMSGSILVDQLPRGVYGVQAMFIDGTVAVGKVVLQ